MRLQKLANDVWSLYDVKDQLKQFVYERSVEAFRSGDEARDTLESSRVRERAAYMREQFIARIGGLPSSDTPLLPQIIGVLDCEGYRIERIIFESRPQAYVTSSLYLPDGIQAPRGAVLFVCGHKSNGRFYANYQRVCQYLVTTGLIVLAIDPIGQGERCSYYEPGFQQPFIAASTAEHEYVGSQCWPLGDGLARYFLHDIMRAIDYLCTRSEVDRDRIGITGSSGGGTQSSMAMLCDPRIAAAAPGTFIMSRESYLFAGQAQDAEQIWRGMSAIGFDHEDILLAMAPLPVLVLAAQSDFFPIEGTRRTVERVKRFWEESGKADNLMLFEDHCEHQYSAAMAEAAAHFFARHLLGQSVDLTGVAARPHEESDLRCTASGQISIQFPAARFVYAENEDRLQAIEAGRAEIPDEERKKTL